MDETKESLAKELMELNGDRYYDFRIYVTEKHKYFVSRFAHVLGDGESVDVFIDDVLRALTAMKRALGFLQVR